MKKTILFAVLTAALTVPTAVIAQDHDRDDHRDHPDQHRYYDRHHKDYHQWNDHEDRAWHMYSEQRHRPSTEWNVAPARERERYWQWRHQHSDSLLHIDIR
jgi:hypothetical protein